MPTNEERREVAHNLRETSDAISDWGDSNPYWYVMKCVYGDVEIHNDNELLYRLADLIDPEPTVDRDALLALARDLEVSIMESGACGDVAGLVLNIVKQIR